jgi:hypothetical protein
VCAESLFKLGTDGGDGRPWFNVGLVVPGVVVNQKLLVAQQIGKDRILVWS